MSPHHRCSGAPPQDELPAGDPAGLQRRAAGLLGTLRRQTNGAVSGAMHERGVDYPINYGVSVAEIRRAAAGYAPDDALAQLLYTRPERELRIAATYIADPRHVTDADAGFWAAGVINSELAGHVALLVGRSPGVQAIMEQWFGSGDELLQYTALMAGARAAQAGSPLDIPRLLPLIKPGGALVDRGVAALISRLWRARPDSHLQLTPFLEQIAADHPCLWAELEWQLDMERDLQLPEAGDKPI